MSALPPVVGVDALSTLDPTPVLVDIRWYLDGRDGRSTYEDGHLPGAVFVDLGESLAGPASPEGGRHPLPHPEVFAAAMRAAGVSDGRSVVVYDDLAGMVAGRLVVMLRSLGHPAALLDGGLAAWTGDLATGPAPETMPGDFAARPWPTERFVSADDVADHIAAGGTVIDARAPERFRGETEPIDARAGHIPGAVNLPFAANLHEDGRILGVEALRERYAEAGADPIVYCGSGVSACHDLLAMELAGIDDARLYVGSWSAWSADPDRPVATGE